MKRLAICLIAATACAFAAQSMKVRGQAPGANAQPGTRLSLDELKKQMFRTSAGRRIRPTVWPHGTRGGRHRQIPERLQTEGDPLASRPRADRE